MWRIRISINLFLVFVCLSCSKIEKVQIDLTSTECLLEIEIEEGRSLFLIDESEDLKITTEVNAGKDSRTKNILFFNEGKEALNFFSTQDKYFKSFLFPNQLENGNGSLWINYTKNQKSFLNCLKKNQYAIKRVHEGDKNYIFLTFYNAKEILPYEGLEIEMKFDNEGKYQLILEFNPNRKSVSQWGLNSIKAIYSPEFNVD